MILNLLAVVLFFASHFIRHHLDDGWSTTGFALSTVAFLVLGVSGGIGGDMIYQHKMAVVKNADAEATRIGQQERA